MRSSPPGGGTSAAEAATGRIVIAEDDGIVAELAARYLTQHGFVTVVAADGPSALDAVLDDPPLLLVLDLALPEMSGVEILRRTRVVSDLPVVVTSGHRDLETRLRLFALGADDYLVKPYPVRELVGRIEAILRRCGRRTRERCPEGLAVEGLEVSVRTRQARRGEDLIDLTALEHALLLHLMRHPGETFSRQQLLHRVWNFDGGDESTVTVLVKRLREKIEVDPRHPRWIETVWGVGYRLRPGAHS